MSKSNTTETDILAKVFQATELSWDGNTNLYVSLHTADPTDTGSQTAFEANYGSYDRVTVARDATGWDVSGDTASNDDLLQFPQASSGSNTITHVAIGTADHPTGGQIIYSGELNSPLTVSTGIQPQFAPNALNVTEA